MKVSVVNIMPHGPAYRFSPDEKPDIWWRKPDGTWLGFWTREWPDYYGAAVLQQTDRYAIEVWQPDYRADKIYSYTLDTGVIHRLFPAKKKLYRIELKRREDFFSQEMLSHLGKLNSPFILQLHGFRVPFYFDILRIFGPNKTFPIFIMGHGMSKAPIYELFGFHRPLTYLGLIVEQWRCRRAFKYVDVISEEAKSALRNVRGVYSGRIEKLVGGCDFDFWIPVPSLEIKKKVRYELGIAKKRTVFLATGNFIPRKQLDRLIEVFQKLSDRDDFFLIIAGHGDKHNTARLKSLISGLAKQGKAILHPYVTGEALRNLYWASDIYVSVAIDEGTPVSVAKAMACGLPVLSTPVGETSELMKKHDVGMFVPVRRYDKWVKAIREILEHGPPPALDINIARQSYHLPNVARRLIRIYDYLYDTYYGTKSS